MVVETETFDHPKCNGTIRVEDFDVVINGRVHAIVASKSLRYYAAAPADRRMSYTGSGLPFANATQALEGSPNQGVVNLGHNNEFSIKLAMPNSYYTALGTVLVPPTLYIIYSNGEKETEISIKISDGIPFRMMTYPSSQTMPRRDSQFYSGTTELTVRSQEEILRSSAYPGRNKMPSNFWGEKPRL